MKSEYKIPLWKALLHRRGSAIVALVLSLGVVPPVWSQSSPVARRAGNGRVVTTKAVKARLWSDKARMDVVLVGRTDTHLLLAPDAKREGTRLEISEITAVFFPLEYQRYEVAKAVHKQDWATAIRLQYQAYEPTFEYLDLPENNAAEGALELGTIMMRAARNSMDEASDDDGRERARKQYEMAYDVFQHCAKVKWSSIGMLGVLKGCRCLLGMNQVRPAWLEIGRLEEPIIGDAAYGHYWLVQAELHLATNGFRPAMDASVKSLCFENKDVETFPDALLISARCYEALDEVYRARDVYYEVARLFPQTEWAANATARLRAIQASGATLQPEASSVESVFLGLDEDLNALVEEYLNRQDDPPETSGKGAAKSDIVDP